MKTAQMETLCPIRHHWISFSILRLDSLVKVKANHNSHCGNAAARLGPSLWMLIFWLSVSYSYFNSGRSTLCHLKRIHVKGAWGGVGSWEKKRLKNEGRSFSNIEGLHFPSRSVAFAVDLFWDEFSHRTCQTALRLGGNQTENGSPW